MQEVYCTPYNFSFCRTLVICHESMPLQRISDCMYSLGIFLGFIPAFPSFSAFLFRSLRACALARHPASRVLCFKWLFLASTGRTTTLLRKGRRTPRLVNEELSSKMSDSLMNHRLDSNPKVSAFTVWDPAPTMSQYGYMYKETTVWMDVNG